MQRRPLTAENATARLEALCARSERCTYELLEKLRVWGIPASQAREIVEQLARERFVDDGRFARSFALDKMRFNGYGRMRIKMALAAKRIDRELIDRALSEIDEEEYRERLSSIIRSRASRMDDADTFEGRTRLFRFAATRGFESSLISEELRRLMAENR